MNKKKSGWGEMQKGKPEVISEMDSGLSVQRSRKTTADSYTATSNRKKLAKNPSIVRKSMTNQRKHYLL